MPVVELMEQKWPIVNSGLILFSDCCDTGYMKSKRIKSFHERQTDNGVLNDGWTVTAANSIPCHCMNTTKCKRANSIFPVLWNYITKFCLAFSQILMKISHHDTNTHTHIYTRGQQQHGTNYIFFCVYVYVLFFFLLQWCLNGTAPFRWTLSMCMFIAQIFIVPWQLRKMVKIVDFTSLYVRFLFTFVIFPRHLIMFFFLSYSLCYNTFYGHFSGTSLAEWFHLRRFLLSTWHSTSYITNLKPFLLILFI